MDRCVFQPHPGLRCPYTAVARIHFGASSAVACAEHAKVFDAKQIVWLEKPSDDKLANAVKAMRDAIHGSGSER